uniref:Endonuclease/exonuclease/phosphatase domain-containing protein n=1 Tax=Cajanus cajan TaxID=3821 RepID=A0A151QU41_CAJCA|nr:hypothetical protein KK1_045336 [Cajanus cajan]
MVQDCNLIDMGCQGSPFTWRRGTVLERLDRVLANMSWQLDFPEVNVFHLHPLKSDHCLVLIKFNSSWNCRHLRPFRFEAAWINHPMFHDVVRFAWCTIREAEL